MTNTPFKVTVHLYHRPDLRILLMKIAESKKVGMDYLDGGTIVLYGNEKDVLDARDYFNYLTVRVMIHAASLPNPTAVAMKRIEAEVTNGFVCRARYYLCGEDSFPTKNSYFTHKGESFADELFNKGNDA